MRRGGLAGGAGTRLLVFAAVLLCAAFPVRAQSLSVRPDPLRPGVLFIGADPAGSLDSPFTVLVSSADGALQSVQARAFERNAVNICTVLREQGQATRARTLTVFVQRGLATRTARLSYDGRSCGVADNPVPHRRAAEDGDGLELEEIQPQRSGPAPAKGLVLPETFRPEPPAVRPQAPAPAPTNAPAAPPAPPTPAVAPRAQAPPAGGPSHQIGTIDPDAIESEELVAGGTGANGLQWKLVLRFRQNLPGGLSRGRVLRAVSGMTGATVLVRKPFEVPLEVDARARRVTLSLPPERLESPLIADELVSLDLEMGGRTLQVRVLAGGGGGE